MKQGRTVVPPDCFGAQRVRIVCRVLGVYEHQWGQAARADVVYRRWADTKGRDRLQWLDVSNPLAGQAATSVLRDATLAR